jgi:hypothetical protein
MPPVSALRRLAGSPRRSSWSAIAGAETAEHTASVGPAAEVAEVALGVETTVAAQQLVGIGAGADVTKAAAAASSRRVLVTPGVGPLPRGT